MKPLVIYHGKCNDGFTSAWIAKKFFESSGHSVEFYEGVFGHPAPCAKEKSVYLLDFTYPYEEMKKMHDESDYFICIDHHVTGKEKLQDLPAYFSLDHSGARLTWDWFYPNRPRPKLVDYVEDRDMWWNSLPYSNEITAVLRSYSHSFYIWDELATSLETEKGFSKLVTEGEAIQRYIDLQVGYAFDRALRVNIFGYNVPIVNSSVLFSEVAGELAKGEHFGVCYFRRDDGLFQYSLRSDSNGIDVSEIAKQFGGGGHKHSAGFQLDYIIGLTLPGGVKETSLTLNQKT